MEEELKVYTEGGMFDGWKILVMQRPSMAAPSWQEKRVEALIVVLSE